MRKQSTTTTTTTSFIPKKSAVLLLYSVQCRSPRSPSPSPSSGGGGRREGALDRCWLMPLRRAEGHIGIRLIGSVESSRLSQETFHSSCVLRTTPPPSCSCGRYKKGHSSLAAALLAPKSGLVSPIRPSFRQTMPSPPWACCQLIKAASPLLSPWRRGIYDVEWRRRLASSDATSFRPCLPVCLNARSSLNGRNGITRSREMIFIGSKWGQVLVRTAKRSWHGITYVSKCERTAACTDSG